MKPVIPRKYYDDKVKSLDTIDEAIDFNLKQICNLGAVDRLIMETAVQLLLNTLAGGREKDKL